MPGLRSAIHSAHDRGVLPQFRPDGNVRMMTRDLGLLAPISIRSLIELLDSLHFVDPQPVEPPVTVEPTTKPQITAVRSEGSGGDAVFIVEGKGFQSGHDVRVRVVDDQLQEINFHQSADSEGKLTARLSIPCISGLTLHFTATDGRSVPPSVDHTGFLFSNTFNISCP